MSQSMECVRKRVECIRKCGVYPRAVLRGLLRGLVRYLH